MKGHVSVSQFLEKKNNPLVGDGCAHTVCPLVAASQPLFLRFLPRSQRHFPFLIKKRRKILDEQAGRMTSPHSATSLLY